MPILKENTTFASRYELLKFLGEGGFAEVWLAKDSLTETDVAVKIFVPDGGLNDEVIDSFKKEFAITLNLNHSHLLKYLHFDIYNKSPYLVMKYCSNGTLFKKIGNNLGEADVAKIMFQIGSALEYLHELGIAHQDIKPENILTDEKGTFLLSDFGISIKTRNTLNRFTKQATEKSSYGSPPYAPPEKYGKNPKQNLEAGDIFALGVMLYEICEGDLPWGGQGGIALIKGAEVPEIDNPEFTNLFKQLINRCMSVNPADRPTAAELKSKAEFYLKEGYWQSKQVKVQPEVELPKSEPSKPKTSRETTRMPSDEEVSKCRPTDRMPQSEKPVVADKVDLPIDELVKKKSKTLLFSVIGAVILCFVLVWGLNSKPKLNDEAKAKMVRDSIRVADSIMTVAAATAAFDTTAIVDSASAAASSIFNKNTKPAAKENNKIESSYNQNTKIDEPIAKPENNSIWLTNLDKAIGVAKRDDKKILVNFSGSDWCIWCTKLDEEVFSQNQFLNYAADNLVLVQIDSPQDKPLNAKAKEYNENLSQKFKITGVPTIVLMDKYGNELKRTGYKAGGAANYVSHIKSLLDDDKLKSESKESTGSTLTRTVYPGAQTETITDIYIKQGDVFSISASGRWYWGGGTDCSGPDGTVGRPVQEEKPVTLDGACFGTLIGKIGSSNWFSLGSTNTYKASTSGYLTLWMSDRIGYYGDNSGSLTVKISYIAK